ncbi:MAG: hypothetical protein ABF979_15960, partial [Gluconobacter sp.]|uniref:hypothetical protein n=1 Tax=Gluconobacter sp. TaxID=1876758 RepID=UPI0039ECA30D
MNKKAIKKKKIWNYIKLSALVFSIPISVVLCIVMVFIIKNDSADSVSSWVSSAAAVASAIATIGVGYFAYEIAQKQKDSGQISVLIDVSRF